LLHDTSRHDTSRHVFETVRFADRCDDDDDRVSFGTT